MDRKNGEVFAFVSHMVFVPSHVTTIAWILEELSCTQHCSVMVSATASHGSIPYGPSSCPIQLPANEPRKEAEYGPRIWVSASPHLGKLDEVPVFQLWPGPTLTVEIIWGSRVNR